MYISFYTYLIAYSTGIFIYSVPTDLTLSSQTPKQEDYHSQPFRNTPVSWLVGIKIFQIKEMS